jgi:nucleoside-diphosphate-sugar epimerase
MNRLQAPRQALVVGAHGGIGGEMLAALRRHGWRVRALARTPRAAAQEGIEWIAGDAMRAEDLLRAAAGCAVVVHAVNPPGYRDWDKLVLPMLEHSIAAARAAGARLVLPGTIYNYGPDAFPVLAESSPQHPRTRKGAIRVQMEQRLHAAAGEGARILIVRAGDFFGPQAGNNWFSGGLLGGKRKLSALTNPASPGVGHAWAYLPDVAETIARLLDREGQLPAFAAYHFAGHWDADGTQMVAAIRRAAGRPRLPVRRFPWPLLPLLAPFSTLLREMREMHYLWQHPLRLDNSRLVALLGAEPHTPLDQAVLATLAGALD